ncbi:39S ribosomal protein L35, mitochondrial [Fopius arisanus]|uniref:Large ribosomal subunit protein bL35m n=1 Tax=Fopius arisanus TaxID=64838 RepID=A0A0C9PM45_9HYME|nr:PREDICTED: 39S ribosomal protein L35, mitochondrial [Fopius arisanus]
MLSRFFSATLRAAVRSRFIGEIGQSQKCGFFERKNFLQEFKPIVGGCRGIFSVVSSKGFSQNVKTSPISPHGNLLTKSVETTVLNGCTPARTVIKWTKSSGKRQTVKTVLKRFYRLNWGIWIRTKAGRHRRRWRKSGANARRSRQHVFCNSTQSWMLDKMVSPYWRKPKYWVDDPYTPYHKREEFWATRKNPIPLIRKPS